jgi:hypothetical protein
MGTEPFSRNSEIFAIIETKFGIVDNVGKDMHHVKYWWGQLDKLMKNIICFSFQVSSRHDDPRLARTARPIFMIRMSRDALRLVRKMTLRPIQKAKKSLVQLEILS